MVNDVMLQTIYIAPFMNDHATSVPINNYDLNGEMVIFQEYLYYVLHRNLINASVDQFIYLLNKVF